MLEEMVRGCSGAGTRGNSVPTLFSHFVLKWVWSCFKLAIFLDAFPHIFISTTSLAWFDFKLVMGTIDWLFHLPIECMCLFYCIQSRALLWLFWGIKRSSFRTDVFTLNAGTNKIGSVFLFMPKYCYVFQIS